MRTRMTRKVTEITVTNKVPIANRDRVESSFTFTFSFWMSSATISAAINNTTGTGHWARAP